MQIIGLLSDLGICSLQIPIQILNMFSKMPTGKVSVMNNIVKEYLLSKYSD